MSIQLEWKHQFVFAGFYAAIEQGYYKDFGLEVELKEFENGINITDEVINKNSTFGISSSALIIDKLQHKPVVLLASYFKQNALVLLTRPEIKNVSDLQNKTIMAVDWEINSASIGAMLRDAGIGRDAFNLIEHDFKVDKFVNGEIDAMSVFITSQPFQLDQLGVAYNILNPANYGMYSYDLELFTSEEMILKKPQMVKKFILASNKGWEYALKHKNELVDLIYNKYSQHKTKLALLYEADKTEEMFKLHLFKIGSVIPELVKMNTEVYVKLGLVDKNYNINTLRNYYFDVSSKKKNAPINSLNTINLTAAEKSFIKTHPEITLASGQSFEPFTILNSDGSISGFDVDIMKLITKKTELKVKFALGNWSQMQEKAKQRQLDGLSSVVITEQRKLKYNFSIPYFKYYMFAIVKKGNPQSIHKISDLNGKRIALQSGNMGFEKKAQELGVNIEFVYFDTIHELIKAVVAKEVDFTILDETANYIAQSVGLSHSIEVAFILNDKPTEIFFALRNDYPELVNIINKSLQSITSKEVFDIRKKWFGDDGGPKIAIGNKISLTAEEVAYLKLKSTIKVCTDPKGMPYEQIDKNGEHDGMGKDYLTVFSHLLGVNTQLHPTQTWAETLNAIKNGKCDILTLADETVERKKYLKFTSAIINIHYSIITSINQQYIVNIEEELDKEYAVISGSAVNEYLLKRYPAIKLLQVSNSEEGLLKVSKNEVYGFIGSLAVARQVIQQKNSFAFKFSDQILFDKALKVATRADEPLLNSVFQKAVNFLKEKQKQQIYNKWISVKYEKNIDYTAVFQILAIVLVFILYREFTLRYYNKKLKKEVIKKINIIRKKNEMLLNQHKLASMGEMLNSIAHQWRQPIATLNGVFANLDYEFEHKKLQSKEFSQYLSDAEAITYYMSKTIEDFRNLFSPDKISQEFDIKDMIKQSSHILKLPLREQNIELITEIQNTSVINSFQSELMQVIIVLVNNAKDALLSSSIQHKKITITLSVNTSKKNKQNIIEVSDNAGGVPKHLLDKIFEPYFSTKLESQGTGLGLYMARTVVEKSLLGSLTVRNTKEGASFCIKL
ncbi:MAG: transporter substrate-binding domain-containing protein [Pseudomonadota bacterium]